MLKWLHCLVSRRRRVEDENRLAKKSDQGEVPSDPEPIEELVRIVGESEPSEPRARVRQGFLSRRPRAALRSRLPRR